MSKYYHQMKRYDFIRFACECISENDTIWYTKKESNLNHIIKSFEHISKSDLENTESEFFDYYRNRGLRNDEEFSIISSDNINSKVFVSCPDTAANKNIATKLVEELTKKRTVGENNETIPEINEIHFRIP